MARRSKKKRQPPLPRPVAAEDARADDIVPAGSKLFWAQGLLIVLAGAWVAAPALHGGWIRDDTFYLNAALMNAPGRLWRIWFQPGSFIEYYPISETVQWVQWQLWAGHTLGFHVTNIVLHLTNALLVWQLLRKFRLGFAWLGGLLFVIHPAQVESVAWISELKNTLSLAPFLVAMMAWIDYEEHGRSRDYLLALGLFLIAMLAKITMALFPFVILLYAWWKRGRIGWSDLKNCAPFAAISLVLGVTNLRTGTWYAHQHVFSSLPVETGDFLSPLALAGTSLAFYFSKVFWPGTLLPIYPQWPIDPLTISEFLPWAVLAAMGCFLWTRRQSWGRHVILGGGFFLINLAPFLGFNAVSYMRFTWVMDHFLYLPIIGWIGLVAAAVGDIEARLAFSARPLLTGVLTVVLTLLAFQAHAYSGAFINEVTLWDYTLEYNPGAWGARAGLADALALAGKFPEAIRQYEFVLELRPDDPEIHNNLALVLARAGRKADAVAQLQEALSLKPKYARAHANLGSILARMGRYPEAIAELEIALNLDPNDLQARQNLEHLHAVEKAVPAQK